MTLIVSLFSTKFLSKLYHNVFVNCKFSFDFSPSGTALRKIEQIKDYLLRHGTCKCGLPCPLRPDYFFEFNPQVSLISTITCKFIEWLTDRKIEFYWECKNCTRLSPSVIRTFNSNIANYERNRNPSYKIKFSLTVSLNHLTLNFKWRESGIPPNSAHMLAVISKLSRWN